MNKKILFLIVVLVGAIFLFLTLPAIIKSLNLKNHGVSTESTVRDPAPYLTGRLHIDVFINADDPGKYYMDTSFMPKGNNTIG